MFKCFIKSLNTEICFRNRFKYYNLDITKISSNMSGKSKKGKKGKECDSTVKSTEFESGPITLDKLNNVLIKIIAKPGAKQNNITDISEEGIGVQINAPPTEGEANTELCKYISSVLGIRKGDVYLEKGFKSRQKTIKLESGSITIQQAIEKIKKEIDSN